MDEAFIEDLKMKINNMQKTKYLYVKNKTKIESTYR